MINLVEQKNDSNYMLKKILVVLFLFSNTLFFAQQMQEGFTYLETGKYQKAASFFKEVLKGYPKNKTAKLCYGRAVGLLGDSEQAVTIFTALKKQYPTDFEIKLNYAEALLWDKQFKVAESFYENLVTEDALSFPAVLGYANTLSNLKKYPSALENVNAALELQKGNKNALNSRKYIRLGYANQLAQNKEYNKALLLLDDNLKDNPNDKDSKLNKANIYLITNDLGNAEKVYSSLATSPTDSIISLNGLALVAHKKFKNKEALEISAKAKNKVENHTNEKELYLATQERYIQALLWNRKYKIATAEIKKLALLYPDNTRVESLKATHGMFTSNFENSIKNYKSILKKQPKSFDGNLGIANAYRATGSDMKSYQYTFNTLNYFDKQPDAEKLLKTLKKSHTPWVQQKTVFTFDNGNNESLSGELSAQIPLSAKAIVSANYIHRNTENTVSKVKATTDEFSLGFSYKFTGKLLLASSLGATTSDAITRSFTSLIGEVKLKVKPYKLQNLELGYQRQLQNFNADLIDREIIMNNYFLTYNLSTNFNLGLYAQYIFTDQTDDNTRNLLFTSLYYNIFHRPIVKTGINYQTLSFKNQVPTIYFSPEKFHVVELFIDLISKQSGNWFYAANAAAGYQFIEDDPASEAFRLEGKLGYKFSDRFSAKIYAKHSNIASATAAGFQFTEFGLMLKWYFLRRPIFNKKIEALKGAE